MAELDNNTIKYLAELSRIAVSKEEEASLLEDLRKILGYAEQLNEVDTSDVEPCTYVTKAADMTPLRDDEVETSLTRDEFLKGAPDQIGGMVRVPPVIKQEFQIMIHTYSAKKLHESFMSGEHSAQEITSCFLDRIERYDESYRN